MQVDLTRFRERGCVTVSGLYSRMKKWRISGSITWICGATGTYPGDFGGASFA